MAPKPKARISMEAAGIEAICSRIANGETYTAIAKGLVVSVGKLSEWISGDKERSARANEARRMAAKVWDEKAEQELRSAPDPFELTRARELASHYRWRASKIAPHEYGDKQQVEHSGSMTLEQLVTGSIEKP